MFTTSPAELEATLAELEANMPPDYESVEGTQAETILLRYDARQLKELSHFGMGLVLQQVIPHLPYFEVPDSKEAHDDLTATYLSNNKFDREPSTVAVIPSLGQDLLITRYAHEVVNLTKQHVTDDRMRVLWALQRELVERSYNDGRKDSLHLSTVNSRRTIDYQLYTFMWGGSRFIIENLLKQCDQQKDYEVNTAAFLDVAPNLRRVINDEDFISYVRKISGLALNDFMVLAADRKSLMDEVSIDDVDVRVPAEIPESDGSAHYDTRSTWDQLDVGCPARIVKGAIRWTPNMMLTACEVVASNPPLPRSSF